MPSEDIMPSTDIDHLIEHTLRSDDSQAWRPRLLRLDDDLDEVRSLIEAGRIRWIHDTIEGQLDDLAHTRHPEAKGEDRKRLARELLGGVRPREYGVWAFYPWSGRLVHVLPRAEFRELRTDRNRNKITRIEQEKLGGLRLGVVGLSVGQATAVTLAMEGLGGLLRLADFDTLALSNLNRLRAGVHELAVPKVFITAREIYELDPYANVEIYPGGVSPENIDEFLTNPSPLDMVFEECDDLQVKILLRERARAHRIPVLMETSDRGMIDIERFDLEPDRPLLHGLIGNLRAKDLQGLSTYEKVPIVLQIIGPETMSRRMAASLVDVESSLASWPQLASAVALGGALTTDSARRMALGELTASGRYYVDLEEIVHDAAPSREQPAPSYAIEQVEQMPRRLPPLAPIADTASLSDADVRSLVSRAILAPSGGNCQPWRFVFDRERGRLRCIHDVARSESLLDFQHLASYLAFGAMAENIELAAASMGLEMALASFPDASDPHEVCWMEFRRAEVIGASALVSHIAERTTNRRLSRRVPLPAGAAAALTAAAAERDAVLQLVDGEREIAELAAILGGGERLRLLSPTMHREMMNEIRWGATDAERTRDGLDVATLELTPTDFAGMRLISSWALMRVVKKLGGGAGLERPTRKAVLAASAIGLVTVEGKTPADYFRAGRAVQRVWLTASSLGLSFQPVSALVYLFARMMRGEGAGLTESEIRDLQELRQRLGRIFTLDDQRAEGMMFRLSLADPPTARSLRREVDEVLTFVP
jgi:molybdopterin/thiamine biosynthesis adenylyltransferase/nitroreductase